MKEIKTLYSELKDKKAFCVELSEELGTSGMTIYNHWFGTFLAIPKKHQNIVLEKLLKKQGK